MPDRVDFYAPILNKGRDDDGVLWVEGQITGPGLDNDQQRMDSGWLKSAVPEWAKVGNVREQHNPKSAVGRAVEVWETGAGDWHMRAKIIDKSAASKVEHGVYSGFSIGVANPTLVKSADAPKGKCAGGRLVEVSVVDRPALPSCVLTVAKAENATTELLPVDEQEERVEKADPDTLAAPEVLEKKGKPFGGKKAPPFGGKPSDHRGGDDEDEDEDGDGGGGDDDGPPWRKADDGGFGELVEAITEAALAKFTRAYLEDVAVEKGIDVPALLKSEGIDPDDDGLDYDDDGVYELTDAQVADAVLEGLAHLSRSEAFGEMAGALSKSINPDCVGETMAMVRAFADLHHGDEPELELADHIDRSYEQTLAKAQAALGMAAEPVDPPGSTAPLARTPAAGRRSAPAAGGKSLTKADVAATVNATLSGQLGDALTKAMEPLTTRLAEVEATLSSTPRGGGPAVTAVRATPDQAELTKAADRTRYLELAESADRAGDRVLASGYRERAKALG